MYRIAIISVVLLFSLSGFVASVAGADNDATRPGVRHARQAARIQAGVEKGSLVPREAHRLRHEQRNIQQSKRRMLASDGKIGPRERAKLHRMQDRASAHISRAKHNPTTK